MTSSDLLDRVLKLAEALQAAVADLSTEIRLQRGENEHLRAVVSEMETAFDLIRKRPR